MSAVRFVSIEEFQRVRALRCGAEEKARLFATLCRLNTLGMIAFAGSGHIGSSFSSLDMVSWLFLNELHLPKNPADPYTQDIYFSSKGHDVPGLYSVLIALELLPFESLQKLRRLGGLPGHPDVGTPFLMTNTGPLGMGISKAKGMVLAKRRLKQPGSVTVLTGDGELQEGQFWESLASAANRGFHEITVIIDHNKIQSDTWVADVSDLGLLEEKLQSFGWHTARCDGHDLAAFSAALSGFKAVTDRPKVLIADTIKGKGVSFMEQLGPGEKLYRFHSGALDDATYAKAADELIASADEQWRALGQPGAKTIVSERPNRPAMDGRQKMVAAYSKALVAEAERNEKIVALDADLILDCGLIPFQERFPERFVECGIAEQDMVSQAGGMALAGLLPVVHSFACFLSTRPHEQIYNNATERTKIVYVGSLAGLLPSGPGHSHQSVHDIGALGSVPGLVLLEPCHEKEVPLALDFCLNKTSESSYLRLVSVPCEVPYDLPNGHELTLGRGTTLLEGTDAVAIGYGPVLLAQAWKAAERLKKEQGLSLAVVALPWLNRVDESWLKGLAERFGWIFTLDNHTIQGGQGEMIAARIAALELPQPPKVHRFGLEGIPACGQNDEVLAHHGLDALHLSERIAATVALARS